MSGELVTEATVTPSVAGFSNSDASVRALSARLDVSCLSAYSSLQDSVSTDLRGTCVGGTAGYLVRACGRTGARVHWGVVVEGRAFVRPETGVVQPGSGCRGAGSSWRLASPGRLVLAFVHVEVLGAEQ